MPDKQLHNFFAVIERNIRQQTKVRGMTLAELVKHIDMTEAGFYKMLSTESIKVKTLRRIAEVLQQPVTFFIDNKANGSKAAVYQKEEVITEVAEPPAIYHSEKEILLKQISLLESQLKDKEKIIQLLSNR